MNQDGAECRVGVEYQVGVGLVDILDGADPVFLVGLVLVGGLVIADILVVLAGLVTLE